MVAKDLNEWARVLGIKPMENYGSPPIPLMGRTPSHLPGLSEHADDAARYSTSATTVTGAAPTKVRVEEAVEKLKASIAAGAITSSMLGKSVMRGMDMTGLILDELQEIEKETEMAKKDPEQTKAEREALENLAARLTEGFKREKVQTTLMAPATITVDIKGKGFRKAPHIGGESFTFDRVIVGAESKGSRLIFIVTPQQVSNYTEAHFTLNEGQELLERFRLCCNIALEGDFDEEMRKVRAVQFAAKEAEEAAAKFEEYPSFGSW